MILNVDNGAYRGAYVVCDGTGTALAANDAHEGRRRLKRRRRVHDYFVIDLQVRGDGRIVLAVGPEDLLVEVLRRVNVNRRIGIGYRARRGRLRRIKELLPAHHVRVR